MCRVPRRLDKLDATEDPCMAVTSYGSYDVQNEPNEKMENLYIHLLVLIVEKTIRLETWNNIDMRGCDNNVIMMR